MTGGGGVGGGVGFGPSSTKGRTRTLLMNLRRDEEGRVVPKPLPFF